MVSALAIGRAAQSVSAKPALHNSNSSLLPAGHLIVTHSLVQDAIPGTRAHGTVTGATPTGIFVSFFNGIQGLVHASALGLVEDQTPEDAFKVGQVRVGAQLQWPAWTEHSATLRPYARLCAWRGGGQNACRRPQSRPGEA